MCWSTAGNIDVGLNLSYSSGRASAVFCNFFQKSLSDGGASSGSRRLSVNDEDPLLTSVLHCAVSSCLLDTVQLILQRGADGWMLLTIQKALQSSMLNTMAAGTRSCEGTPRTCHRIAAVECPTPSPPSSMEMGCAMTAEE